MRILVVEDDKDVGAFVVRGLKETESCWSRFGRLVGGYHQEKVRGKNQVAENH